MLKKFWLIAFAIVVLQGTGFGQVTNITLDTISKGSYNPLKGLRRAEPGDIAPGVQLKLDPNKTPILYENLSLIQGDDYMKIVRSGDYKPEPYIDCNKVIKAFVMKKLTEEEKAQRKQRQNKTQINDSQSTLINKNNPLEGLRRAEPGDIASGTKLKLDPNTTPMFYENLSLIQSDDFMKIMMSGDYKPEPYFDSNKVIKAFVMKKLTEQEKAQRKQRQSNMQNQNSSDLIGKEAFPFSVTDIYGNKYSLDKLKGKVIVLNFWFIECKPCVMEIPELNEIVDKYKGKEVVFIGFATNDLSKIESFLKTKTFKYNIIADNEEIAEMYKVSSYPTHIIIDTNSIISYSSTGLGPNTMKDLDNTIESLIK